MQEENYMFRLSAFQPRLVQWLEDNPQGEQARATPSVQAVCGADSLPLQP